MKLSWFSPRRIAWAALLTALVAVPPFPAAASESSTLFINEFVASNGSTLADEDGDFPDWIELYNAGSESIDLSGHHLSDDPANPTRWTFPGGEIPAGGFLIVWASGKDRDADGGPLHTNFSISSAGEPLSLTAPDGVTLVDAAPAAALDRDVSYGRIPDGGAEWIRFSVPSPGAPNSTGMQFLAPPEFSHQSGFFESPFALSIENPAPLGEVRYTLDGSNPTEESPLYETPLPIDARTGDPNVYSEIDTVSPLWEPPDGEVFKASVVRASVLPSFRLAAPVAP